MTEESINPKLVELSVKIRELDAKKKALKEKFEKENSDVWKEMQTADREMREMMEESEVSLFGHDGFKFKTAVRVEPKIENQEVVVEWLKEKGMYDALLEEPRFKKTTFYAAYRKWYDKLKKGGEVELPPEGSVSVSMNQYISITKI